MKKTESFALETKESNQYESIEKRPPNSHANEMIDSTKKIFVLQKNIQIQQLSKSLTSQSKEEIYIIFSHTKSSRIIHGFG